MERCETCLSWFSSEMPQPACNKCLGIEELEATNKDLLEALEAIIAINIPYPTTNVQGMKASEMKSIARAAIAKGE